VYGGYFDSKEEAEKYRDSNEHYVMVAEYIACKQKYALVFQVKTCFEALKEKYESKKITPKEVAIELYRAGHYAFVPNDNEALKCIRVAGQDN